MTKLKAIKPKEAKASKPKITIFGKPGVGKTWTSLDFPSVYYIDTESGANLPHYTDKLHESGGVYLGVDQGSNSFATILEQVQALATEKHLYRTLIIDSISKVFNDEVANEAERLERLGIKNEFGRDKKPAVQYMKRLISWLTRLDMNVILIAHEKSLWKNGEQIGETFDCWDKLEYELHLLLNIFKQGNTRKARITKTRLQGFIDSEIFNWSYEDFAKKYGKDIIEAEAKPIKLATPEQVAEISRMLEIVNIPEKETEKWLKKANAESWAEMETDQIEACIEYINNLTMKEAIN